MLDIKVITANDPAFDACFQIREAVFVVEQGVPLDIERDEYDDTALHFLAIIETKPVATARVILKDNGKTAKIGRVAVLKSHRGKGLGRDLLKAIEASPSVAGAARFVLDAQTHALAFYEGLGYEATGPEFLDAGIPHLHMTKARGAAPHHS